MKLLAETAHPFEFRFRRRFDRDNRARHSGLPRGEGDALSGIARANGPNSAIPLFIGKHRDCVRGSTQFVRVDWLKILQLEPNVWKIRPDLDRNERRSNDRLRDPLARLSDFV